MELDDLISIGTIGLMKAISTFDPGKTTRLSTYAARCIDNELLMMFRTRKKHSREVSLYEPIGTDKEGNEIVYDADTVLYAIGMRAKTAEVHELLAAHPNTRIIGDCKKPAKILQAVRDGMMAAYDIV